MHWWLSLHMLPQCLHFIIIQHHLAAMKDHGNCCQVTKFPYPEPIFNECLMEAIGDLYATPTDFWRPGVAGPKFNMSTNRVEAMVVEFDSNIKFSFSHNAMNEFYQQVETWFSKVIGT